MTTFELFLSPGDEGGQTLDRGLTESALQDTDAEPREQPLITNKTDAGGDPNSLADQGWGVVVPRGSEGDRLLEVIAPLIDARREQCGRDIDVFRVPPDMDASRTITWRDRAFTGNNAEEDLPWYLLVLGGPDQVSLEFQQVMSSSSLVGRLAFDADEPYEAYVDKLLRTERDPPSSELARALFFTARDGTAATTLGGDMLMRPTVVDARDRIDRGLFAASDILELEGSAETGGSMLLDAAGVDRPSILFSCSHGVGAPRTGWRSRSRQMALQGALVLGDGRHLAGHDLVDTPFLPGGFWFYFACFGAATPNRSAYAHWLARLQEHGEYDDDVHAVLNSLPDDGEPGFIAALPQAVLANPDGPLAMIGHIDLAWSYSFQDVEKFRNPERHRRFQPVFRDMLRGHRIGHALKGLFNTRAEIQTELAVATDADARAEHEGGAPESDPAVLGHRWMLHQDLDGYILLGDPAARLAVDEKAIKQYRRETRSRSRARPDPAPEPVPEIATQPAPPPQDRAASVELADMVDAVYAAIAGSDSIATMAANLGVTDDVVRGWMRVYDEAGIAALRALRDRGDA